MACAAAGPNADTAPKLGLKGCACGAMLGVATTALGLSGWYAFRNVSAAARYNTPTVMAFRQTESDVLRTPAGGEGLQCSAQAAEWELRSVQPSSPRGPFADLGPLRRPAGETLQLDLGPAYLNAIGIAERDAVRLTFTRIESDAASFGSQGSEPEPWVGDCTPSNWTDTLDAVFASPVEFQLEEEMLYYVAHLPSGVILLLEAWERTHSEDVKFNEVVPLRLTLLSQDGTSNAIVTQPRR